MYAHQVTLLSGISRCVVISYAVVISSTEPKHLIKNKTVEFLP